MESYKIAVSNLDLDSKLLPGDPRWRSFNASFDNVEIVNEKLLETVYSGHAITTQHKNNWRSTENYICGQHIGLDFDSGDETSSLKYLSNDPFVLRYGAFVHTTISHTPDHPRSRVIFLLDTPIMQAKNYAMAARSLLWLFGTADRQCKDAARFFYGAPECEFEYIDQVLPVSMVKKLIHQYVQSGEQQKKKWERPAFLPPASQQEVADALKKINPWHIDYDEWLSVLMAIHSQFGEGGYALADNWADGKHGEVAQKWRSFKRSGNESGTITISTLFAIAKRFGWESNQLTARKNGAKIR